MSGSCLYDCLFASIVCQYGDMRNQRGSTGQQSESRPNRGRPKGGDQGLKVKPFINATGTQSWRVFGVLNGERIRRNFESRLKAESCRHELESARLNVVSTEALRATWLSGDQLRIAEGLFHKATGDDLTEALGWWLRHGKNHSAAAAAGSGISLRDAFEQYQAWLPTSTLREPTRVNLRTRMARFVTDSGHARISDITPDFLREWLDGRKMTAVSRDNERRAVSSFLSWCMEPPRKWLATNPATAVRIKRERGKTPPTFTPDQCTVLMRTAERYKEGRQTRHLALLLFGGIRPVEATKLREDDVNIEDGEVRIRAEVSKTHTPRTVPTKDCPLNDWLRAYPAAPLQMPVMSRRRDMVAIMKAAGIAEWPVDVLRHTAASALIRRTGSYAAVADRLGNSESILRKHYSAGWATSLAERWAAILPSSTPRRGEILPFPTPAQTASGG